MAILQDQDTGGSLAPAIAARGVGIREWWMVVVLFLVYISAFIDRGGMPLLVAPIRADLGLSDVQMSLLLGVAFATAYGVVAIPAGYLADLLNRRALIGGAILVWSAMSASCGFANNFWPLFFSRSGLATAEGVLAPSAHSMIRDAFPPESRGRAFSLYTMAPGLGLAAGLFVAGTLIALGDGGFFQSWPVIGHFKTWQIVLALPGMCTLPLALIMLTVREPARRASAAFNLAMPNWGDAWRYVRGHSWVYLPFFGALVIGGWAEEGFAAWLPTALIRGWNMQASTIAHVTGTIGLTCGVGGLVVGSTIMDWATKRGHSDAPIRLYLVGRATALVCNLTLLHLASPVAIFGLLGLTRFVNGASAAATAVTLSAITPSRLMGRMTACMFLSLNLLSSTGATAVALIAKYCFSGPLGIVPAMSLFYGFFALVGIGLLAVTALQVQRFHHLYEGGAG